MGGMIIRQISESGYGVQELSQVERKSIVYHAESILNSVPQENKVDFTDDTDHVFADGVYSRKLFVRKGCWLTGKIHRFNDILIVAQGDATFFTEHETRRLIGPCCTVVVAGTKPLIRANEDTTFYNAHPNPTNEQDLDKLEEMFIIPNEVGKEPGELVWRGHS